MGIDDDENLPTDPSDDDHGDNAVEIEDIEEQEPSSDKSQWNDNIHFKPQKEDLFKEKSFDMSEEFLEKQFGKGFKMSDDFKRQMGNDNIFD